jgi:hypothetical protein
VNKYTLQHYRDGELLEEVEIKVGMVRIIERTARIVFPAGHIEFATADELRFDKDGLIEFLQGVY